MSSFFVRPVELKRDRVPVGWTMAIFGPCFDGSDKVVKDCAFRNLNMSNNGSKRHTAWQTAEEAEAAYLSADIVAKKDAVEPYYHLYRVWR